VNTSPRLPVYRQQAWDPASQPADVLVIGAGAAGLTAAMEAAKHGLRVLVVDKGIAGRSGSTPTSGGASAVLFPDAPTVTEAGPDSPEAYFDNLRQNGELMNAPRLVRIFVDEAWRRVLDTREQGVEYVRAADGRLRQHRTMGHTRPRTTTPIGGSRLLMSALRRELLHRGVQVVERTTVTRLLVEDGRVVGVAALNIDSGDYQHYRAKAVVLAGGSATALFRYQSANFQTTGDAWVLGYNAGARLVNTEFMEFTIIPKVGKTILPSSGISPYLAFGGKLYDRDGERILRRYDPERMETTSRATIAYAVYAEWAAGRGPVTNDPADFGDAEWAEISDITNRLASVGLDYRRERFEWVPALHTCLGGMVVDADAWTGVPGLWAAGECTSTIHGANRLSSCAIPDCYVFGYRAGRAAARYARTADSPGPAAPAAVARDRDALRAEFATSGEKPTAVIARVRDLAWEHLGLSRDAAGLEQGLAEIAALQRVPIAVGDTASLVRALDARNLLQAAEFVALAAATRRESRGQHRRTDYPARDDANWVRWVALQRGPDGVQVGVEPIPTLEATPAAV